MEKFKKILGDALALACTVILTLLVTGLLIFLLMEFHSMMLEVMNNNCYTNVFGELICKVK